MRLLAILIIVPVVHSFLLYDAYGDTIEKVDFFIYFIFYILTFFLYYFLANEYLKKPNKKLAATFCYIAIFLFYIFYASYRLFYETLVLMDYLVCLIAAFLYIAFLFYFYDIQKILEEY